MLEKSIYKAISKYDNIVIDEIVKSVGIISDSVFLRNTITINPGKEDIKLNFSWLPKEEKLRKNYINVSIL